MKRKTRQGKATQNNAKQSNTTQNKAKQSKANQRTKQSKAKQSKAKQTKPNQSNWMKRKAINEKRKKRNEKIPYANQNLSVCLFLEGSSFPKTTLEYIENYKYMGIIQIAQMSGFIGLQDISLQVLIQNPDPFDSSPKHWKSMFLPKHWKSEVCPISE